VPLLGSVHRVQPAYAPCGWHSLSLWRSLRQKLLLPPLGVPAFNASWHPRSGVVFSEEQAPGVPSPGLVVLEQRSKKERSLLQSKQIHRLLVKLFPAYEVVSSRETWASWRSGTLLFVIYSHCPLFCCHR